MDPSVVLADVQPAAADPRLLPLPGHPRRRPLHRSTAAARHGRRGPRGQPRRPHRASATGQRAHGLHPRLRLRRRLRQPAAAPDGTPEFFADATSRRTGCWLTIEPRIYFGEESPTYSIVGAPEGATPRELDFPDDTRPTGRPTTPTPARAASRRLVCSASCCSRSSSRRATSCSPTWSTTSRRSCTTASRASACEKVAPWLTLDGDPYPAVVDGRIVWIVDGYTTSERLPVLAADDLDEATADAHHRTPRSGRRRSASETGQLHPQLGEGDGRRLRRHGHAVRVGHRGPGAEDLEKAFAGHRAAAQRDPGRACSTHLRYPEDLFKVQRELLARYHVTDPQAFYGGQDFWEVPNDPTTRGAGDEAQPPYYLYAADARHGRAGVLADHDVRAAATARPWPRSWRSTPNRQRDYGTIRVLRLPGTTQIPGPGQVQNEFASDHEVAQRDITCGRAMRTPARQPAHAAGRRRPAVRPAGLRRAHRPAATFPLLRKVIVSFGEEVGFADTLQGALDQIFEGESGAQTGEEVPPGTGGTPGQPTTPTPAPTPAVDVQAALQDAIDAFTEADAALRAGDLAAYAEAVERASRPSPEPTSCWPGSPRHRRRRLRHSAAQGICSAVAPSRTVSSPTRGGAAR